MIQPALGLSSPLILQTLRFAQGYYCFCPSDKLILKGFNNNSHGCSPWIIKRINTEP